MRSALAALLLLLFTAASRAETINVAAAISLKDVLSDVASAYEKETGNRVTFTFGASGQLAAQVKAGAPVDVFLSAAVQHMDELAKADLIDPASRRDVAGNSLVLIVPADSKLSITGFVGLVGPGVRRVATGEPRTVPAGEYARQCLQNLKLLDALGGRLIYGSNVRQVLSYVERGEVSAGIVYATDAMASGPGVRVVATADPATHDPVVYPGAVTRGSRKPAAARKFLDFLRSDKARTALEARGFVAPPDKNGKPSP